MLGERLVDDALAVCHLGHIGLVAMQGDKRSHAAGCNTDTTKLELKIHRPRAPPKDANGNVIARPTRLQRAFRRRISVDSDRGQQVAASRVPAVGLQHEQPLSPQHVQSFPLRHGVRQLSQLPAGEEPHGLAT